MTNGEMIQKVFNCEVCEPIIEDDIIHVIFADKKDSAIGFDWSWWNAEYKEPTTKNDLGVDAISRIETIDYLCKHCPDDGECFKDCDEIKHLRELPSVTPQEPKWIPVSERLPKIADVYRVTRYYPNNVMNPNYLVDACFFDGSNTWYNDNRINHERAYADNVIAWQENPEPYKVDPQESEK